MGLTGSQKAIMYALGGVARAGATRAGYTSPKTFVSVGGVQRSSAKPTAADKLKDLTVRDLLNENPNTAQYSAQGWTPTVGQDVIVTIGSINNLKREFAGQNLNVQQSASNANGIATFQVNAIDYTWGLNKRKVTKRYTATTIGAVATDLMASYATGYTLAVDPTFGAIHLDEISFTNQELTDALSQLVGRGGGYWRADYSKVVRLFLTDTSQTQPTAITNSHPTLEDIAITRDLSQIVTRVFVEGMGSAASQGAGISATSLRVDDLSPFPTAGTVVSGPQRITYTGIGYGDPASAPWIAREAPRITWNDVIWADSLNLFVAIGENYAMTSPDGVVWTLRTLPEANTFSAIGWAPSLNLLVAVGATGTHRVVTSPDGITWTARTASAANQWADLAWSPSLSLFVAVSSSAGGVMTSPDGVTWTSRTPAAVNNWAGVAWSPSLNLFAAVCNDVGATFAVMTSPDGITWTGRTALKTHWNDIDWSSALGLFAAISTFGEVMTSPDGIAWTVQTTPSVATSAIGIIWSDELALFVVAGVTKTSMMTSSDGITWIVGPIPSGMWFSLAWSATLGLLVVVGNDTGENLVATSGYTTFTGIPASGAGSIANTINSGDEVQLLVQVDDTAAQTALAALIGGDGIQEEYIQDRRITYTEAVARGEALLALRSSVSITFEGTVKDPNMASGTTVSVNLPAPMSVVADFTVQEVTIANFQLLIPPTRRFTASTERFSLNDLLRRIKDAA
jgi:hypothetical protein